MSLHRVKPLIGGELKAEEEPNILNEEDNSNHHDGWLEEQLQLLGREKDKGKLNKWIKNYGKRKRSRRKKDKCCEERRIARWHDNAQQWKTQLNNNKSITIIKSHQDNKRKQKLDDEKRKWYGDQLKWSRHWPEQTENGIIRIYGQNINGISQHKEYNEWEIILEEIHNQQIDISCFTEVNLDLTKATVKYKLQEKATKLDKNCNMIMTSSKAIVTDSETKRGGILTLTRGNWSGRIIEKGHDKLGRWTHVTLQGKDSRKLTIITIYRVCNQKNHGDGGCTIYMQQEKDLLDANRELTEPREALLKDVTKYITKLRKDNHDIILLGDMNSNLDTCTRIDSFLLENEMYDAIKRKHPGVGPATYDRGSNCLDLIAISNSLDPSIIKRCGYLPFYHGIFSDHRGMYVDLDIKAVFNKTKPDTTREIYKRFTTSQVDKCKKYINNLKILLQEAAIERKVDELKTKMEAHDQDGTGDIQIMISDCKKLFNKTTQLMKASEKKVGKKPYKHGYPSSSVLRKAAKKVIKIRKKLRYERTATVKNIKKMKEYENLLQGAKLKLKIQQKMAPVLCEKDLNDLAAKRAEQWNLKASKAIIVIKNAEEAKKTHRKQRIYLKPITSGIRKILVPTPRVGVIPNEKDITDASIQCTVDDPKSIFNVLLRQNFQNLLKSNMSVFSTGPICQSLGFEAEKDLAEKLLEGMELSQDVKDEYSEYGSTLTRFIQNMKKATTTDGNTIKDFQWSFGIEEYKAIFKKTKETTACGPSGIHMSHWVAALEDETLMKIHSFYIWAAFNFGFTYDRWNESWHCMLQKKAHPFSQKLRIIQLFEGDFNAGLKYLLGKLLMWHAHDNAVIDDEVFGSRKGKTGAEALLHLQLLADHTRIWKKNLAVLFNDAAGCYDRVPPNLAELALRRIGCPPSIARAHTKTQRMMKHYIKTSTGVSPGYIKFSPTQQQVISEGIITILAGLIGGIGQGGGASPIIWLAILLIMLGAYKQTQDGANIIDIITSKVIQLWIISYVDDNSIVKHFQHDSTIPQILTSMKQCLQEWHKLLQITGGDLCLEKCKLIIMRWKQVGERGNLVLMRKIDCNETIKISSIHDDTPKQVERIDPDNAERVLGIRLPLTGDMSIEKDYRKEQLLSFCKKLYRSPLNTYDAHIAFQSRYIPKAKYPLPVTTFSPAQLNEIQKPSIQLLLPKLGLNRHMPRAVVYGPRVLGGLQLMDLKVEQPTSNILTTIGHLRREDRVADMLLATLRDLQIETGSSTSIFQLNPSIYTYVTENTRWLYTWRICREINVTVHIWNEWLPTTTYERDQNIMDVAIRDKFYSGKNNYRLVSLNRCRLYLQCFFISELMNNDNKTLDKGYLDGSKQRKHPTYSFPPVRKPTKLEWSEWKAFIFRNFLAGAYIMTPAPIPTTTLFPKNLLKLKKYNNYHHTTHFKKYSAIYQRPGSR